MAKSKDKDKDIIVKCPNCSADIKAVMSKFTLRFGCPSCKKVHLIRKGEVVELQAKGK